MNLFTIPKGGKGRKVTELFVYRIDLIKGPFILYECGVGWWKFMGRAGHV